MDYQDPCTTARWLKVRQINLNRSRTAMDLLCADIKKELIDVVIGQEPNRDRIRKMNSYCDTRLDCFIYTPKNVKVISVKKGCGFVAVQLQEFTCVSCYYSPNERIEAYETLLEELFSIVGTTTNLVIGGDLNAKSFAIGSPLTNNRGHLFDDFIAAAGLVVINDGIRPTFRGAAGESWLDFTAATQGMAVKITEWRVQEDTNLSDHCNISFSVLSGKRGAKEVTETHIVRKISRKVVQQFCNTCNGLLESHGDETLSPSEVINVITKRCEEIGPSGKVLGNKRVYWWNDEISQQRKKCNQIRRELTRDMAKHNGRGPRVLDGRAALAEARKHLRKLIGESKKKQWSTLCDQLEKYPFGDAYKLVRGRFSKPLAPSVEEEARAVSLLFELGVEDTPIYLNVMEDIPPFTKDELSVAIERIRPGKAPGPDGLPPEIIKACLKGNMDAALRTFNTCLESGAFPSIWKVAKLTLIDKGVLDERGERKFRPICLLDVMGKILEHLVRARLEMEVEQRGLLSEAQFGFRRGRSTLDAIEEINKTIADVKRVASQHRKFCVMITLDVENAFNRAPWKNIVNTCIKGGISPYLINMISSYLSERKIVLGDGSSRRVRAGVPQGSVLGPLLWNILFDKVLAINFGSDVKLIAYADDLAVIVLGRTLVELENRATAAVLTVKETIEDMGLRIAQAKTEAVILYGGRRLMEMKIPMSDEQHVTTSEKIKYLGVMLGRNLRYTYHINWVCDRAVSLVNALRRIIPSTGGPGLLRSRVIASTVTSAVLYGAAAWAPVMDLEKYRASIVRISRRLALMCARAYRTVSTEAAHVIAGIPPLDLVAGERREVYLNRYSRDSKSNARRSLIEKWVTRWNEYSGWCRSLVPDLESWLDIGPDCVDHYVAQALTGHGVFASYLKRIGKQTSEECWFCPGEVDTPDHALFRCSYGEHERARLALYLGTDVNQESIALYLIQSTQTRDEVAEYLRTVMKKRVIYEKLNLGT